MTRLALALAALTVMLIPSAALLALPARPFTVVETGRSYSTLQQAITAVGSGTATIRIAGGTYSQCAVQSSGTITYAATPGSVVLRGVACEGKAALVLRGAGAKVDGLTFADIRVADKNGAGIRLENGNLTVRRSVFRNSEQGIMSVNGKNFRLTVEQSTFSQLGTCEGVGGCAHSIYMGSYGELVVNRCRFQAGTGGHYVKSRAARTTIADSSFDDSAGTGTNYMIDLPNGARGAIRNNWFLQGANKGNGSILIAIGAEGVKYDSTGLEITGNDAALAPDVTRVPTFIADWTRAQLYIVGNTLEPGIELVVVR